MKEQKKSKIEHMFKNEMFVPWCSVHDNITLMMASEKLIVTSDDKTCKVEKFEHYHILSDYAEVLVKKTIWDYSGCVYENVVQTKTDDGFDVVYLFESGGGEKW